jgi:mannitol operon transcriptional antiterminator
MYFTSREKAIIELIIKQSGKHTASSIASDLNVSVRTIHRDLKTIEKVLESFGLQLARNTIKGFIIEGKNEQLFRLIQYLTSTQPIDQTPKEKKLLLLLALLEEEAYKIQGLASYLGISISTLTSYLDDLTNWIKDIPIEITRKKGVGVEVYGTESNKRKALARFFLQHFNEELIESLFLIEKGKSTEKIVLYYLQADYLSVIDRVVNSTFHQLKSRLADSDYMGLIVQICITIQRTEDEFLLAEEDVYSLELTNEYSIIVQICKELERLCAVTFTKEDLLYLAVVFKGSKLQAVDAIPYDRVVLNQMVKNIIRGVSSQLHVDFTNDFSLFQGLLAHLEPSLFRLKQKMGLYNPLTEEIKRKYPLLFIAVKNSVEQEFIEIDFVPDDEIAFIVLHFGSALVMREEEISINALVVCPTGIGTSKMLASRIKREINEIDSVEISSIKEIERKGSLKNFDIIISTVRLPFIEKDYILVSPLLTEENVQTIRSFLKNNIERLTEKNSYIRTKQNGGTTPGSAKSGILEVLEDLDDIQQCIQSVLQNFQVYHVPDVKGHEKIIEVMVRRAEENDLLNNAKDVIEAFKDRERIGGLGIPHTEMGFFHCRHVNVQTLFFQIASLEEPVMISGMDGKDMPMKQLLLMAAPEELSLRKQEIISLISTSLIENQEAIMIYSSSNEDLIRSRLEKLFLDYLLNNVIRE